MRDKINTRILRALGASATSIILFAASLGAQSSPQPATPATAPAADLNQLMRALFFPNSNVIFFTQGHDPAEIRMTSAPSTSTDPLTGVFGGWPAVENSALTLADAADLLMTPGRKCSNGRDVPVSKADWAQLVNQLREAAIVSYNASKTKDRDKMTEASDVLNTSCANCHNKYRSRVRCQ